MHMQTPQHHYVSAFDVKDKVLIDGHEAIVAVVTGVLWRPERCELECAWWNNGSLNSLWVTEDRLSMAPEHLTRKASEGELWKLA